MEGSHAEIARAPRFANPGADGRYDHDIDAAQPTLKTFREASMRKLLALALLTLVFAGGFATVWRLTAPPAQACDGSNC
jgi:hypothetical protein